MRSSASAVALQPDGAGVQCRRRLAELDSVGRYQHVIGGDESGWGASSRSQQVRSPLLEFEFPIRLGRVAARQILDFS